MQSVCFTLVQQQQALASYTSCKGCFKGVAMNLSHVFQFKMVCECMITMQIDSIRHISCWHL